MTRRPDTKFVAAAGVIAVLAALGALAYVELSAWWHSLQDEDEIPTEVARREAFVRKIRADGNLRAVRATALSAPPQIQGQLKISWLLPDGTRVAKDDVVVRFDASDAEKELIDGKAARATAQNKIQKQRISTATTQRNRDRAAVLAERELETTRKFQKRDELIFARNQIIESEIDGKLSGAKLDHASAVKSIDRNTARSKLDLLAIEKRAAELKIEQAKKKLTALEVRAPHAGVVVLERDWLGNPPQVGATVWSGSPLAEIPLIDEMEAEVYVLEADASGLEPGKSATVILEAHPGVSYDAKVEKIATLAKPRLRDVPIQYFEVTLKLEKTDKELMKPGQRVRATLILDDREAIVVPRQAVFERDGETIVYRQGPGGGFEPVPVELGPSTPGRVIIEKGLEASDRVALRDPTRPVQKSVPGENTDETASAAGGL